MKRLITIFTIVLFVSSIASAGTADVMLVVDESGSMSTEHAWIPSMVTALDTALVGAGVTGNQYALVGFGDTPATPRTISVGGGDWGTAAQLATAAGTLATSGGIEDGYAAMKFGLDNYTWRAGAVSNIILITDEDRDKLDATITRAIMKSGLEAQNALLNVVIVDSFDPGTPLGVSSDGTAYYADGSGGYTTGAGGTIHYPLVTQDTYPHDPVDTAYITLAWELGGAAWDLNLLRAGGNTAVSFTNAFVDVKVEEITEVIPAPGAILLGSIGVGLVGWLRRRRTL